MSLANELANSLYMLANAATSGHRSGAGDYRTQQEVAGARALSAFPQSLSLSEYNSSISLSQLNLQNQSGYVQGTVSPNVTSQTTTGGVAGGINPYTGSSPDIGSSFGAFSDGVTAGNSGGFNWKWIVIIAAALIALWLFKKGR